VLIVGATMYTALAARGWRRAPAASGEPLTS